MSAVRAKLNDVADLHCDTAVHVCDCLMKKECLLALKSLRSNSDILITKPGKGSGVVVMDPSQNILKMEKILYDTNKFKLIGPSCDFDNTAKVESKIQRQLLQLKKDGLLPPSVYKAIRPTGSQVPRLYGLLKTHKEDLPIRPILFMIGSAQQFLAKWLTSILDPVLLLYSTNYIQNSFTFAEILDSLIYPLLLNRFNFHSCTSSRNDLLRLQASS